MKTSKDAGLENQDFCKGDANRGSVPRSILISVLVIVAIATIAIAISSVDQPVKQAEEQTQQTEEAPEPLTPLDAFNQYVKGETIKIVKSTQDNGYYEDSFSDSCNARFSKSENEVTLHYTHTVKRQGSSTDASFTTNATFQYDLSETEDGNVMLELTNPTFTEESPAPPSASEGDNFLLVKISDGTVERITGSIPAIGIQDIEAFGDVEESADSRGNINSELRQRYDDMEEESTNSKGSGAGNMAPGVNDDSTNSSRPHNYSGSGAGSSSSSSSSNSQSNDENKCPFCGKETSEWTLNWQGMCDDCVKTYKTLQGAKDAYNSER